MIRSAVRIKRTPRRGMRAADRVANNLEKATTVVVGLPKGSNAYPDGTSVIEVGAVHEFGVGRIPERSFLRSTVLEKKREYKRLLASLAKKMVEGMPAPQALGLLGTKVQSDVQAKFTDNDWPPLSPQAAANRKNTDPASITPLVDTGHLRQSITYEVR